MHYFLYPTKDTSISNLPALIDKNMGLDEILEVEKMRQPNACGTTTIGELGNVFSRALLQFDLTDISRSIVANDIPMPKFYLTMKVAQGFEVPTEYSLSSYPISREWTQGTGYKSDGAGTADGATWRYANGIDRTWWDGQSVTNCEGGGVWVSYILDNGTSSYDPSSPLQPYNPSASLPVVIPPYTGSLECSQTFTPSTTSDVRMDITKQALAWMSNTITNYGLIVLHSGEMDLLDYGKLRFFSKETNTIYSPHIDVVWNDQTYITGSVDEIDIRNAVVSMKNIAPTYRAGAIIPFIFNLRPRYAMKTFTNYLSGSAYSTPYRFPQNSMYAIKDAESAEIIIPYDEGTKISFDPSIGNYFSLDTTGLPQERYYKILVQAEQAGAIMVYEVSTPFKISR